MSYELKLGDVLMLGNVTARVIRVKGAFATLSTGQTVRRVGEDNMYRDLGRRQWYRDPCQEAAKALHKRRLKESSRHLRCERSPIRDFLDDFSNVPGPVNKLAAAESRLEAARKTVAAAAAEVDALKEPATKADLADLEARLKAGNNAPDLSVSKLLREIGKLQRELKQARDALDLSHKAGEMAWQREKERRQEAERKLRETEAKLPFWKR